MAAARKRLWVTETPPVKEALDELRAELGVDDLPFEEILIRGAAIKIAELGEEEGDDETPRSRRASGRVLAAPVHLTRS